jgi:type VI secretion system protein ImpB
MASIHDKLDRVRRPRVHIKYEVETEGAQVEKELPFVVGVLGDFSGQPTEPLKPLKDRKFVQIDRDNFDEVMSRMSPGLKFRGMDDFEPARVADQVPALRNLLEKRNQLRDLLAKADRSEELESLLERILQSDQDLQRLAGDIARRDDPHATGGEPA